MDEFEKLGIDCPEGEPDYPTPTFRMQPCFPPVWDTAQAVYALGEAGVRAGRSAHGEGGGLAAVQGGSAQGRLGGEGARMSSRAAGTSSSTMSFIRMWMIRGRFCWR